MVLKASILFGSNIPNSFLKSFIETDNSIQCITDKDGNFFKRVLNISKNELKVTTIYFKAQDCQKQSISYKKEQIFNYKVSNKDKQSYNLNLTLILDSTTINGSTTSRSYSHKLYTKLSFKENRVYINRPKEDKNFTDSDLLAFTLKPSLDLQ